MKYTNSSGVPLALALWLANDTYGGYSSHKKTISVTTLIRPLKQIALGFHVKADMVTSDVTDVLASRLGTAIHDAVESTLVKGEYKAAMKKLGYPESFIDRVVVNPEDPAKIPADAFVIYSEKRTEKIVGDWCVSGEFDLCVDGQLEDIKSTKVYGYINDTNSEKYMEQGSLYRWLNPDIITKDTIKIDYIFTDYSSAMAQQEKRYPKKSVMAEEYPLKPYNQTDVWVKNRLKELDGLMLMTVDEIEANLPMCTDEELWRKPDVYKYYKDKTKTVRSTKNFDNFQEAYARLVEDGSVGTVLTVKGAVVACKYCKAFPVCKQKDQYILDGSLEIVNV